MKPFTKKIFASVLAFFVLTFAVFAEEKNDSKNKDENKTEESFLESQVETWSIGLNFYVPLYYSDYPLHSIELSSSYFMKNFLCFEINWNFQETRDNWPLMVEGAAGIHAQFHINKYNPERFTIVPTLKAFGGVTIDTVLKYGWKSELYVHYEDCAFVLSVKDNYLFHFTDQAIIRNLYLGIGFFMVWF